MIENSTAPQPLETQPTAGKQSSWVGGLLVAVTLVAVGAGAFWWGLTIGKTGVEVVSVDQRTEQAETAEVKKEIVDAKLVSRFTPLAPTTAQSIAAVDKEKLVLLPIDGSQAIVLDDKTSWGSGAYGLGTSDPVSSPDLHTIAFINDGKLRLVSADGKQSVTVSPELTTTFIGDWSPDSQKLLLYNSESTLKTVFIPEGPVPEESLPTQHTFSKKTFGTGFYLVDVTKGTVEVVPPMRDVNFIAWIGPNQMLISREFDKGYMVFNLDTYTVDRTTVSNDLEQYFGTQFSVDSLGKNWALTLTPSDKVNEPGSEAQIVLAQFPSLEGKVLAQDRFAAVQGPFISPNGKQVAFRGYDYVNGPNYVYWYDGNETKRLFEGWPKGWISDTQFIYASSGGEGATSPSSIRSLNLYDTQTGSSKELYSFSQN